MSLEIFLLFGRHPSWRKVRRRGPCAADLEFVNQAIHTFNCDECCMQSMKYEDHVRSAWLERKLTIGLLLELYKARDDSLEGYE